MKSYGLHSVVFILIFCFVRTGSCQIVEEEAWLYLTIDDCSRIEDVACVAIPYVPSNSSTCSGQQCTHSYQCSGNETRLSTGKHFTALEPFAAGTENLKQSGTAFTYCQEFARCISCDQSGHCTRGTWLTDTVSYVYPRLEYDGPWDCSSSGGG